jgi:peptidoglycan/xylan/chitin deacetylase (PgdA/CDA1 family)
MESFLLLLISFFTVDFDRNIESIKTVKDDKEVVCFIYHRFGDSRYPSTNVSEKDFEMHLKYLVDNDFQILTFSQAVTYLRSEGPSKKTVVITVDDGYKSFYTTAFPLLKKYNIQATLFINTETAGGGDYMSWDELKDVAKQGIEIGNHTHTHNYFLNLPESSRYKTFQDEIVLSQSIIKKNLDIQPIVFSYPYGEFDAEIKKIVKQAGFVAAAAQNSGVMRADGDFFQFPRFPMAESYAEKAKFIEKTSMHALQVISVSPETFVLGDVNPPVLNLTLASDNLDLRQLQCFVQGGECDVKISKTINNTVSLTLQAKKPLGARRRTLYTLTIRDKAGRWHWYSHLWINPAAK